MGGLAKRRCGGPCAGKALPLVSTPASAGRHRTQNPAQEGISAEFSRPPISEFFNTIAPKPDKPSGRVHFARGGARFRSFNGPSQLAQRGERDDLDGIIFAHLGAFRRRCACLTHFRTSSIASCCLKNQQAMIRTFRTGRLVEFEYAWPPESFFCRCVVQGEPMGAIRPFLWGTASLASTG